MMRMGAWLLAAAACAAPLAAQNGLQQAIELVQAGDFARALDVARSDESPLRRHQALLYVRHHAGDLEGALQAGLEGLKAAPKDPWLLERTTYIALSVRADQVAARSLERLEAVLREPGMEALEAERLASLAFEYRRESEMLSAAMEARERALTRAKVLSAVVLVLGGAAFFAWTRRARHGEAGLAR